MYKTFFKYRFFYKGISKKFLSSNNYLNSSIPVIDIEPLRNGNLKSRKAVAKQIDEANREIGFFLIKNTGIDFNHVHKTLKSCEEFFLSSLENKMKCRIDNPPENKPWGYFPQNMELLQRSKDFNSKEKKTYFNDINEQYNLQNDNPNGNFPSRIFPSYPESYKENFSK